MNSFLFPYLIFDYFKFILLSKLQIINYELRIGLHLIISILQKINHEVIF